MCIYKETFEAKRKTVARYTTRNTAQPPWWDPGAENFTSHDDGRVPGGVGCMGAR